MSVHIMSWVEQPACVGAQGGLMKARLDPISSMRCPSNISFWQVMDQLTRNIHETLSSRLQNKYIVSLLWCLTKRSNDVCAFEPAQSICSYKIHVKHILLAWNWFAAIWIRAYYEPKTWVRLSRICDCPFILLLSKLGGSSSTLSLEPIGRLILNPRFSLVKWQQERVSVASLPARYLRFSSCLEFDWIRCQWGVSRSPSQRYQSPIIYTTSV